MITVAADHLAQEHHSAAQSLLLHLAPPLATLLLYVYAFEPASVHAGLPVRAAYVVTIAAVPVPMMLGILLWSGWRQHRRLSLTGVVLNRHSLTRRQAVLTSLGLLLWAGFISIAFGWTDGWLQTHAFGWLPDSILNSVRVDVAGYPPVMLIGVRVASVGVIGVGAPFVEELYFRGYLLPRMPWPEWLRIPLHSLLFTAGHLLSPWGFITRMLILIPLVAVVSRTRSLSLSIALHCLGNTIGELLVLWTVIHAVWIGS